MPLVVAAILSILVGVVLAGISIIICPKVMNATSFVGEYFGGILWAVFVTFGAAGIVLGAAMLWAAHDGVATLQQFV